MGESYGADRLRHGVEIKAMVCRSGYNLMLSERAQSEGSHTFFYFFFFNYFFSFQI